MNQDAPGPRQPSGTTETVEWLRRVDGIFAGALECDDAERGAWLDEACGGDDALRAEVEELLSSAFESGDDLSARGQHTTGWLDQQRRRALGPSVGQSVAGYTLLERLGEGGMGTVYLAEREDGGLDRRVALKVLRQVGDERRSARFAKERRVLAGLEHPHIARLYDGGVTEEGVEYFVMEWVRGEPIDRFAEHRSLSRRRRVELMVDVCRAVEAAHQNLVVHRDLKPSNILVDEQGSVKLLDFGIATMLAEEASGEHPGTFTSSALTLQYASPEQWRGELAAVTSDVYQIGLLLHELAAGSRPYELEGASPARAGQLICDVDPPAATGGDDPDLDAVIGRALRKEPGNRYSSAEALRLDLERWLQGLPVQARPLGTLGRARKFVRRHRTGVLAALSVALLLALVVGAFSWRLHRESVTAQLARQDAEATADYLEGLFNRADPNVTGGEQITVLDLLVSGSESLAAELQQQPRVRARLLRTHGRVLGVLGEAERSRELLEGSVEIWRSLPGAELELAATLRNLGSRQLGDGDVVAAYEGLEESLTLTRGFDGSAELEASVLTVLAQVQSEVGEVPQAEETFLEARRLIEDHDHDHRRLLGVIAFGLADLLSEKGELHRARDEAERAVELLSQFEADRMPWARALNVEANVLSQIGERDAARARWQEALALYEEVHIPGHPAIQGLLNNLAIDARERGAFDEARGYLGRAEEGFRSMGDRRSLITVLINLGNVSGDVGDHSAAEAHYLKALSLAEAVYPDAHPEVGIILFNLGELFWKNDRLVEAEDALLRSSEAFASSLGEESVMTSYPNLLLGRIARGRSDLGAAIVFLERAWAVRAEAAGLPVADRREAGAEYAEALESMGREEEAAAVRERLARLDAGG